MHDVSSHMTPWRLARAFAAIVNTVCVLAVLGAPASWMIEYGGRPPWRRVLRLGVRGRGGRGGGGGIARGAKVEWSWW